MQQVALGTLLQGTELFPILDLVDHVHQANPCSAREIVRNLLKSSFGITHSTQPLPRLKAPDGYLSLISSFYQGDIARILLKQLMDFVFSRFSIVFTVHDHIALPIDTTL